MKIICIGRNYREHARELNNPVPDEPLVFMKPESALLLNNRPFFIPEFSNNLHHELELVVRINRLGKHIDHNFAHRYYNQITLGIDFTARDLQDRLRAEGKPWEISKGFDGSAVLAHLINRDTLPDPGNIHFHLDINGQTVQRGRSSEMLFDIDTLIAYASKFFTLKIGDLIYTGTPAGVGPVRINDHLEAYLEGEKLIDMLVK